MQIHDKNIKEEIKRESNSFKAKHSNYGTNSDEKIKDALGQFYTPPELVIQMLEMYDCTLQEFSTKTILDPTCGSGNLIMGALITGLAYNDDYPENVFGNELDLPPLNLARERFANYCKEYFEKKGDKERAEKYNLDFWSWHLHQGDALNSECIDPLSFDLSYEWILIGNEGHVEWNGRRKKIAEKSNNLKKVNNKIEEERNQKKEIEEKKRSYPKSIEYGSGEWRKWKEELGNSFEEIYEKSKVDQKTGRVILKLKKSMKILE